MHQKVNSHNGNKNKRLHKSPNLIETLIAAAALPPSMADSVITTEKPTPKITRDQPNLSDCVACNRHINTSGDDRLCLLTSLWRIVLLCKHCFCLVESGNLCSYCFQSTTITTASSNENENELRRCTRCDRGIHGECFRTFEKCPPWKFMGLGGSDCVCVDCWMPKVLEREGGAIRVRKGKGESESCGDGEKRRRRKLLEEADSVARKKVAVAEEAKENAMLKAVAARSAVELASGALDMVAKRKSDCLGSNDGVGDEGEGSDAVVVDDAQLAFQLHRAMNSSPRIARNLGFSEGGLRRRGKGSERNGVSCLGRSKGGSGSVLVSGMCGLGSEAGVQTSSSSKSMNLGGHDGSCLDAESGSCVEQHKAACSGETEQKCCEKPTANVNSLDVQDVRYLRKYGRKKSRCFEVTGGELGCRAIVAHLKCSDHPRAVADAS